MKTNPLFLTLLSLLYLSLGLSLGLSLSLIGCSKSGSSGESGSGAVEAEAVEAVEPPMTRLCKAIMSRQGHSKRHLVMS